MKLAWKPVVFLLYLLCFVEPTFALEIDNYDPRQEYSVHSGAQSNDQVNTYSNSTVFTYSQLQQSTVPEAGASGIPNQIETANSQSHENASWFQQFGINVSKSISQTKDAAYANMVHATQSVSEFVQQQAAQVWQNATWVVTHPIENIKQNIWFFAPLILGPAGGALTSTSIGRSLMQGAIQLGASAAVSTVDLALHGMSYVAGAIICVATGVTVAQGYELAKRRIKKIIRHDIGSFHHDVEVVVTVAVIAGSIYFSTLMVAEAAAAGKVMMSESPAQLSLRAQMAMNKTTLDCNMYAGQCDTPVGAGITLASNTLLGFSPNLTDDVVKGEINTVSRVLSGNSDEVGNLAMRIEISEANVGREFIKKYYGSSDSEAFRLAAKKYPNALRAINEGDDAGHVIERHLVDDEYLFERFLTKDAVSSFNTPDDLLSSVEKALTDKKSLDQITSDFNKRGDVRSAVTIEMSDNVGKVLKKSSDDFESTNTVLIVFKRDSVGNIYVRTGYPVER